MQKKYAAALLFVAATAIAAAILLGAARSAPLPSAYLYCVGGYSANGINNGSVLYSQILQNGSLGTWHQVTPYPSILGHQSCMYGGGSILCAGGAGPSGMLSDSACTYNLSAGNGWDCGGAQYPENTILNGCAVSGMNAYCAAGLVTVDQGNISKGNVPGNFSYSAVLQGGHSNWSRMPDYPVDTFGLGCASSGPGIYCVGGYSQSLPYAINSVYYSYPSANGISEWYSTTPYPLNIIYPSCFASGQYLYCTGGRQDIAINGSKLYTNVTGESYYARITQGGLGGWNATTAYPLRAEYQSCAAYGGRVYCVGGTSEDVEPSLPALPYSFYANLSSNGIGEWNFGKYYPVPIYFQSCTVAELYGNLSDAGAAMATGSEPINLSSLYMHTGST